MNVELFINILFAMCVILIITTLIIMPFAIKDIKEIKFKNSLQQINFKRINGVWYETVLKEIPNSSLELFADGGNDVTFVISDKKFKNSYEMTKIDENDDNATYMIHNIAGSDFPIYLYKVMLGDKNLDKLYIDIL